MQDLNDKINDGGATAGGQLTASEWNQLPSEVQHIIESAGMALSGGDLEQAAKAIAAYSAGGDYYTDSGIADAYSLVTIGGKKSPPAYFDGMRVRFIASNTNTGPSTINVNGLGVKDIRDKSGVALIAGILTTNEYIDLVYDLSNSWFAFVNQSASETEKGIIELATTAEAQALTDALRAITPDSLNDALKGANQSLITSGYQKFPGGLIVQWGQNTVNVGSEQTFSLPIAFPNAFEIANATQLWGAAAFGTSVTVDVGRPSLSQISLRQTGGTSRNIGWIAIGH